MQILFTAFEADPFMKTGGLADVAGSMPSSVAKLGEGNVDIRVMLPKYSGIPEEYVSQMKELCYFYVDLAWRHEYCGILYLELKGVTYYFLDSEHYFYRKQLYGDGDDAERIAFFSKACLEACLHIRDFSPDIIHCNDWHTCLVPVYLREFYMETKLSRAKTVFTIHNLKFQGIFDPYIIGDILGLHNTPADVQLRQWVGSGCCANFLMGGCLYADVITTVSPTYAQEICMPYYGEGLDWLFSKRHDSLTGILNGIDCDTWNPQTDACLKDNGYTNYGPDSLDQKVRNKLAFQKEAGLPVNPDVPLFAIISRLTEQKGLDLVTYLLPHFVESEMQLAVLGIGDYQYEEAFGWYAQHYPDKIAALIKFDNSVSHKLYAAADVMMVPSRFEPCGLTQLISMRYGTIPLVRETGGLKDTVNETNGFSFLTFNADDMKLAVDCALDTWYNKPDIWREKQLAGMNADHSWNAAAQQYLQLYTDLIDK